MILEALETKREIDDIFGTEEYSILGESVEFDSLIPALNELEDIDEAKAVTFGKKAYPKDGWSVVMAGGAGSGKGFTISKQLLIDAKILDVDAMKIMFAKASAKGGEGAIASLTGGREFNFKNSKDVSDLHAMIGTDLSLDKKRLVALVNVIKQSKGKYLPNLIFDITGKTSTKLMNIANTTKRLGYKNAIVWVVTNRQVALIRNMLRDRVVGERLFHEIHNQVSKVLLDFLQSNDAKDYQEGWIVFSGSKELSDISKAEAKKLFNNSVHKLEKQGSKFLVPDELMEKIVDFLGPEEENPNNTKTYKNYKEIEQEINPYKDEKTGKIAGYKDLKLTRK